LQFLSDCLQGFVARFGVVDERNIDIHRQSGHIVQKEVQRSASLHRKIRRPEDMRGSEQHEPGYFDVG